MIFKTKHIENKTILIDTNIWLFLFSPSFIPPTIDNNKINMYDNIFNKYHSNNQYVFNSLIISEFINRCLRNDFNSREEFKDFKKDYRQSDIYKETLRLTLKQVEKIYKIAKPIDDDFKSYNISLFHDELDFNDSVILFQCQKNNFLLLTDDKDFNNYINIKWWI